MDLKQAQNLLENALHLAQKEGALAAECAWGSSHASSFSVCDDELERSRTSVSSVIGLRVLDSEHRQGVAALNDLDESSPQQLCDMAFANAQNAAVETDALFAEHQPQEPAMDLGLYDPALVSWPPQEQIQLCMEMSRQARRLDNRVRQVRSSSVAASVAESLVMNSFGVSVHRRSTLGSVGLTLIAEENGAREIGGAGNDARSLSSVTAWLPVDEAVEHTVRMLNGKPLPTGYYTLVLEPEVTASFLSALSDLFSASNVCKGFSLLADKMGQKVASDGFTLVDDGRLYGGIGTAACDGECVATGRTVVLDRGSVAAWLCNLQYGKRLGLPSSGNGSRGPATLPDVDVNNFFVMPGERSWEDIVAGHDGCFCVTDLMGLHTVDTVTGDFSLAARGLYYKNGIFSPVSSVTIAGNLLDFMGKISEAGGDLRFYECFGGCTLVVEDIAVAGR